MKVSTYSAKDSLSITIENDSYVDLNDSSGVPADYLALNEYM